MQNCRFGVTGKPLHHTCQSDNEHLISAAVPIGIQQNATFILIISALPNRSDLHADENGVWKMTGCRPKYYSIVKDENGRVVEMERVHDQAILMLVSKEDHTSFPRISGITRTSCPSNLEREWTSGSHLYFSTTRMTANLPSSKRAQSSRLHKRDSNMD